MEEELLEPIMPEVSAEQLQGEFRAKIIGFFVGLIGAVLLHLVLAGIIYGIYLYVVRNVEHDVEIRSIAVEE